MLQNLPNSFVTSKEVSTLIPNAINNFYTLWWRQQTAKGSVAHFSTLTTWGDWDEKCGNFMTVSHYFSVLHSSFCTRKSGFTILSVSFISLMSYQNQKIHFKTWFFAQKLRVLLRTQWCKIRLLKSLHRYKRNMNMYY